MGSGSLCHYIESIQVQWVDILFHNTPKPSICQTSIYGMTPLQVAVKHHQGLIVRRLIDNYETDPNACKALETEFTEVTLMEQGGLRKSFSFVKFQAVIGDITNILSEHSNCWKIFLDPKEAEDAGTPSVVAAFQSKQYNITKFLVDCNANCKPLFECATLEGICQLASVRLVQQYIHNQLHTNENNYESVVEVVAKLGNTDMDYFLTHHQIHIRACAKAVIQVCQQGFHDIVHLLIQHDEYLVKSIQHYTNHDYCHHPLCIAIRNSDVTVAAMLCESGARLFNVCRKEAPLQHTLCKNSVEELLYWRQDEFIDILPRLLPENINQSSLNSFLVDACSVGCTRAV